LAKRNGHGKADQPAADDHDINRERHGARSGRHEGNMARDAKPV